MRLKGGERERERERGGGGTILEEKLQNPQIEKIIEIIYKLGHIHKKWITEASPCTMSS